MHPQFSKLDGEGQFVFLRGARSIGPRAPDRATGLPTGGPRRVGSLAFRTALDGVEILLGDHRLGEARAGRLLIAENVAAGAQRITARKDGYKAWEREIQVVPNERAEVVIDLEALAAANVIRGDDGAEVLLVPAGEFVMGSTPRESEAFVDACKAWGDREVPKHRVSLDAFHIGGPAVPALVQLLHSANPKLRTTAAGILGGIGPDARVAMSALKALAANNPELRPWIAEILTNQSFI